MSINFYMLHHSFPHQFKTTYYEYVNKIAEEILEIHHDAVDCSDNPHVPDINDTLNEHIEWDFETIDCCLILMISDNYDYHFQEHGGPDLSKYTEAPKSNDLIEDLAYWAHEADIRHAMQLKQPELF